MAGNAKQWLEELGLGQYADAFAENDIDLDVMFELTEQDLHDLGLSLGHRRKLLRAIAAEASRRPTPVDRVDKAERRQITIMFCDLMDSTSLSVRFDPEDLRAIIRQFQDACEAVVQKYGGKVARYMGDGLLVHFGYPEASEHDPENAVRAGKEIVSSIAKLAPHAGVRLRVRVGIATGNVVVGDLIGHGASREQAVVGETPNLASRLQGIAAPDDVVISDATKRLVGGLFEYVDLGLHTLKGFEVPVPAWSVGKEAIVGSRFEALRARAKLSQLVGRDHEIAQLREFWQQARDGAGRAVAISGEAGIGKSRLALHVRGLVGDGPLAVLTYSCAPHYQQSALLPVVNHLENAAGFKRSDSAEARLDKLESMLKSLELEAAPIVPLYASLLAVPTGARYPPLDLSPRLLKEKTFAALEEQLAAVAARQPVLIVFEDLHWVDPTTLELLDRVIKRVRQSRILMIITVRPSFHASWLYQNCSTIHLNRLSYSEAAAIIADVSGAKPLPEAVVQHILDKADGVPLYVEELTRSMMESGQLHEMTDRFEIAKPLCEFAVPSTLRGLLTARLERLVTAKEVAEVGAAIGRQFSYELLRAVMPSNEQRTREALERLIDSRLVDCTGAPPHSMYSFRHALIQDAAYGGLLLAERRTLHRRIAQALRGRSDESNVRPELVAYHYTKAGDARQAITHWQEAAKQARDHAAHVEAIKHVKTALELLEQLQDDAERVRLELHLRVALGINLEAVGGYTSPEVAQNYARARELCDQFGYTTETVPVLLGLFVFHLVRADHRVARDLAEQCMHYSERANRVEYLIDACAALGHVLPHLGELRPAVPILDRCVALSAAHRAELSTPITAQDPAVASLCQLGLVSWLLGLPDGAVRHIEGARALAATLDHPINAVMICPYAAEVHQLRGEPAKAAECASEGVRAGMEHGYDYWALLSLAHLGIANASLGRAEGHAETERALAGLRAAGALANFPYFLSMSAEAALLAGDRSSAARLIAEAFETEERTQERFFMTLLYRMRGLLKATAQQPDEAGAESDFMTAAQFARAQGARSAELRAVLSLHRLHLRQNRGRESLPALAEVYSGMSEGLGTADLVQAKALLDGRI